MGIFSRHLRLRMKQRHLLTNCWILIEMMMITHRYIWVVPSHWCWKLQSIYGGTMHLCHIVWKGKLWKPHCFVSSTMNQNIFSPGNVNYHMHLNDFNYCRWISCQWKKSNHCPGLRIQGTRSRRSDKVEDIYERVRVTFNRHKYLALSSPLDETLKNRNSPRCYHLVGLVICKMTECRNFFAANCCILKFSIFLYCIICVYSRSKLKHNVI